MNQVRVSVDDSMRIFISQQHFGMEDPDQVCLTIEQVDLVIDWLKQARELIKGSTHQGDVRREFDQVGLSGSKN